MVDKNFNPPLMVEGPGFLLRPLYISDVVKDYDAVMSSVKDLQGIFGRRSAWPSYDLSFEQDLIDLGWHHKEFQKHTSFAYTVMSPDQGICLGCVYLYPSLKKGYDVEAYCWVRSSVLKDGTDEKLFAFFKEWVNTQWPFESVAFPGRDQPWEEWEKL